MISIKANIDTLEDSSRRLDASAGAYADVLRGIEEDVLVLFPQLTREHVSSIRNLRLASASYVDPDQWRGSADEVRKRVRDYSRSASELMAADFTAVREVLNLLGTATQSMEAHSANYSGRFQNIGRTLEDLAQIGDPDALRKSLQRGVIELRAQISAMDKDGQSVLGHMRAEMESMKERLCEAELLASTDPLTGLLNRRAMESWIARRISEDVEFCLLLFDLNDFKSINDRFGHATGDQALIVFARVLADNVRPGDRVSRWAGDEFLALLECTLSGAMIRSRQIADKLCIRHPVRHQGREIRLDLAAAAGVAQHRPGETGDQLFERVDQLLYAAKATARTAR